MRPDLARLPSQAAEYRRLRDNGTFDRVLNVDSNSRDELLEQLGDLCDKLGADVAAAWDEDLRTPS